MIVRLRQSVAIVTVNRATLSRETAGREGFLVAMISMYPVASGA
jgi:hypothetical protein